MNETSPQQRYFDLLTERVGGDRYPSGELMDRIEDSFSSVDQVREYLDLLLDKIGESRYPSKQMLDRARRVMEQLEQLEMILAARREAAAAES